MKGHNAYCNYTAAYSDNVSDRLPLFIKETDFILHAGKITTELGITKNNQQYTECLSEKANNQDS